MLVVRVWMTRCTCSGVWVGCCLEHIFGLVCTCNSYSLCMVDLLVLVVRVYRCVVFVRFCWHFTMLAEYTFVCYCLIFVVGYVLYKQREEKSSGISL